MRRSISVFVSVELAKPLRERTLRLTNIDRYAVDLNEIHARALLGDRCSPRDRTARRQLGGGEDFSNGHYCEQGRPLGVRVRGHVTRT